MKQREALDKLFLIRLKTGLDPQTQQTCTVKTNRYTSQIALYKALGGGFVEEQFDYSMWKNTNIFN